VEHYGGALSRLRAHFSSSTNCNCSEVDHHTKYSINLYGLPQDQPSFDQLANLFAPATVDACYAHDGTGTVSGYKNEDGNWNIAGHSDRIVRVTDAALAVLLSYTTNKAPTAPRPPAGLACRCVAGCA
jgi:hypothetical protein